MSEQKPKKLKFLKTVNSDKELDAVLAEELGISPGEVKDISVYDSLDQEVWNYVNEVDDLKYEY